MPKISIVETKNIIRAIKLKYGKDLNSFPIQLLRYKLDRIILDHHARYPDILITRILEDNLFYIEVIHELYTSDFELFRDPEIWLILRNRLIDILFKDFSKLNILIPECTNGFELYSLLIFLEEVQLLKKTRISINYPSESTKRKIFSEIKGLKSKDIGLENFRTLFPSADLEKYFSVIDGLHVFRKEKLASVNIISPSILSEKRNKSFNLVLFRDRLIHYSSNAQRLYIDNLAKLIDRSGILILGYRETPGTAVTKTGFFDIIDESNRMYRKKI